MQYRGAMRELYNYGMELSEALEEFMSAHDMTVSDLERLFLKPANRTLFLRGMTDGVALDREKAYLRPFRPP